MASRGSQSFPTPVLALAQEGSECGAQKMRFSPGFVLFLGKTFGFPKKKDYETTFESKLLPPLSRLFPKTKWRTGSVKRNWRKNEKKQELQQKDVFNGIM